MDLKYELQRIISGVGQNLERNLIEAAAYQLRKSKEASRSTQTVEFGKSQEAAHLVKWANEFGWWFCEIDKSRLIARGAEQRVYLAQDLRYLIKLNDSIFYEYWLDYFNNLLIHKLGIILENLHDENVK